MKLSVVFLSMLVCACDISHAQDCQPSVFPPDPQSGCCGRALSGTTRRVGSFVEVNEYPWMGLIEYKNYEGNDTGLYCSAVLISARINVRLGEYDTNNEGPDCVDVEAKPGQQTCTDGAITIPIEQSFKHPDFNFATKQEDIAVIKLAQTAPYTNSIRPICLPTLDVALHHPEPFYMAVAGWGAVNSTISKSNVLRQVLVPYVKPSICWPKYTTSARVVLTDRQICAGSRNRDSCSGDSGGPLMYKNKNVTEVAGLVSYGKGRCGTDVPGIYTKVYAYKEWINKIIQEEEAKVSTTTVDPDSIHFRE